MNEHSSALRAAAIERAVRAIEAAKVQVIGRDWQSGEHRLDLVATPGDGILAAVEVRAVAHGTFDACITAISEARIRQLAGAAREWMREHDADYDALWLVIVTADPDGSVEFVVGNAAEVA
jgi:Holliday junction resolvase-like predicted endonuclease